MITRVLIANRGEIALRILRACRQLGIEAVVAYSEADRMSRAVLVADEAVCIGPAAAKSSYLSAPALISAALAAGCDAIHPGYGFLSENAAFAEAAAAHGLTFIGPSAKVLEAFESKAAVRTLLAKHGLPTIPGSDGVVPDVAAALAAAERIGYPVIAKASAGGGGRGMRIAHDAAELERLFPICMQEAQAAFGDGTLYMEKFIVHTGTAFPLRRSNVDGGLCLVCHNTRYWATNPSTHMTSTKAYTAAQAASNEAFEQRGRQDGDEREKDAHPAILRRRDASRERGNFRASLRLE